MAVFLIVLGVIAYNEMQSTDDCRAYSTAIQAWGARSEANADAAQTIIDDLNSGVSTQDAVSTYLATLQDERASYADIGRFSQAKEDAAHKCDTAYIQRDLPGSDP